MGRHPVGGISVIFTVVKRSVPSALTGSASDPYWSRCFFSDPDPAVCLSAAADSDPDPSFVIPLEAICNVSSVP